VVVAIFEWMGSKLLGVEQTGPIAPFVPMMMFRHPLRALDGLRGLPALAHP